MGAGTNQLAISPDGSEVYVSSSSSNKLLVFDTNKGTVTGTISVGTTPGAMVVTTDGSKLYVMNATSNNISVIQTNSGTVSKTIAVGTTPSALAISTSGNYLYVSNAGSNSVSVINTAIDTVATTIPLGASTAPAALAVAPNGQSLLVANKSANTVSVISTTSNTINGSPIAVGTSPSSIAFSADGLYAYVANDSTTGTVSAITLSNSSVSSLAVGGSPLPIASAKNGSGIFVGNTAGNSISRISGTASAQSLMSYDGSGRCTQIQETGASPSNLAFIWCGNSRCETRSGTGFATSVNQFFSNGEKISGTSYFYNKDHLGSVRELTNSAGAVVTRYQYDPYGQVTGTHVIGTVDSDFQYAGYYSHAPSGLNLTRTRAYMSSIGRFISRDRIEERGGTNLYCYVKNNPILSIDPMGTITLTGGVSYTGGLSGSIQGLGGPPTGNENKSCASSGAGDGGDGGDDDPGSEPGPSKHRLCDAYCSKVASGAFSSCLASGLPPWFCFWYSQLIYQLCMIKCLNTN